MTSIAQTTKPAKQRRMLFQAPDHLRYKHFAAPLSPEIRKSHVARSLPVRRGDTVRVMRGDRKGFEGKVTRVDRKNYKVYIEGLTREKVDGTTIFVPVHPSKVMITKLALDDKWRKKILERKKGSRKTAETALEKPDIAKPPTAKEKPKRKTAKRSGKETEKLEVKREGKEKAKPRRQKKKEESKLG